MSEILSAERLQAEVDKLLAERRKLLAEEVKFNSEARKMDRERAFYPAVLLVGALSAGAALASAFYHYAR